jgi:single-strand DNA-binding protein
LEIVVVPNKSLETTSAGTEIGKQSSFAKEVPSVRSGGFGFRRAPEKQAVIARTPQAASGPPPAAPSQGNAAQGKMGLAGQRKLNKVTVTGRLGRNAVVRQTKNGRLVANFSVAVDESYKDLLGESHKKTAWHRVQVWEELAETVSAGLQKGVRVYVEGRRAIRNWIDRENRKHCYTEIVASDVRFLDPAPSREARKGREVTDAYAAA